MYTSRRYIYIEKEPICLCMHALRAVQGRQFNDESNVVIRLLHVLRKLELE